MQHAREQEQREEEYASRDVLNDNYRTILAELTLLTTVSVLLFGFLLGRAESVAENARQDLTILAMAFVATATMVFVLPVAYHHVEFPYESLDRFKARSHRWTLVGLPLLAVGMYLSLGVAIWPLFSAWGLLIAALPYAAAALVFVLRKGKL